MYFMTANQYEHSADSADLEYFINEDGVTAKPKKKLAHLVLDGFANLLGLLYHIALGLAHGYAWYILLLKSLFMLTSPIYILLPVTIATIFYYATRYTRPDFSYANGLKLQNIWYAAQQQIQDIYDMQHFMILCRLILPSFSIILLLYSAINYLTPYPANLMLHLIGPMLATLAVIAVITLIYLAIKPLNKTSEKAKEYAPSISPIKTISYIILAMLFYTACGAGFGAIINFFFNPILNYHFCKLSSITSWMLIMGGFAAFISSNLLFNSEDQTFKTEAAKFYDTLKSSKLFQSTWNAAKAAVFGAILAVIIFSVMFAPMVHIVPNIWPHIFAMLSPTAFSQALAQVSYISAAVSSCLSLLDSAFTINTPEPETAAERFNCFSNKHTQKEVCDQTDTEAAVLQGAQMRPASV
jgi:hypothetical protein